MLQNWRPNNRWCFLPEMQYIRTERGINDKVDHSNHASQTPSLTWLIRRRTRNAISLERVFNRLKYFHCGKNEWKESKIKIFSRKKTVKLQSNEMIDSKRRFSATVIHLRNYKNILYCQLIDVWLLPFGIHDVTVEKYVNTADINQFGC